MKKTFWLFLFLPFVSLAQTDCQDPYRSPDDFHIILTDYNPVCGCDGKTYRNSDAAYWWGAINYWTSNEICDEFDIDLYPNVSTSNSTVPAHLRIFMKNTGTATVTIFDSFGNLMFEKLFSNSNPNQILTEANPYDLYEAQVFRRGIYIVIVTVGGDKKYRKLIRVTE